MDTKEALKVYFGFDTFKKGQEDIINTIISGRDVLAVMPTGSGKSICYQIPAMLFPGITIVISPLISLMQDQVKALNESGIHAGYINSSLTEIQIAKAYSRAIQGEFKILYVAPERLESYGFTDFVRRVDISMVTVDEAHCISQWGQDFRTSYLKIVDFIESLPKRPIVSAFTATATEEVKTDISCVLKLVNPNVVVTGFDRENLFFSVEAIKKKDDYIVEYIEKNPSDSGIIYCATRKNVDAVYELLKSNGIRVSKYHAGMANEDRKNNQDDFIYDRSSVIVATNAFGMGIDKSNVRFVIHYNMPQSMENYYQEAGRAGRDGENSQCILLFSAQDIMINKFLLDHKDFTDIPFEDIELIRQRDVRRLHVMEGYCRTSGCLRNYILEYFGEKRDEACDNCGNCHREYTEIDMTAEAKLVVNCIYETKGRYGLNIVLGTLLGANRARLKELGILEYRTYGCLKDHSEDELRLLLNQMLLDGYIIQTVDRYSVVRLGNIEPLKSEDTRVIIRFYKEKEFDRRTSKNIKRSTDSLTKAGYELFEVLRNLRLIIAREEALPPYIIFSDKTLIDMCVKLPRNRADMLDVSGVGDAKFGKYGERFLHEIELFLEDKTDAITSITDGESADNIDLSIKRANSGTTKKTKKKGKTDFCLSMEDAEKFDYMDLYYASEISDELNRISTVENVKKCSFRLIWEFLVSVGYVEEKNIDGKMVKVPTTLGNKSGIQTIEKVGPKGYSYSLLMYPPKVQSEIVRHFINCDKEEIDESGNLLNIQNGSLNTTFDESVYNQRMYRPNGAGASWDEEEDRQLRSEYEADMRISEIAKIHNRTHGAIRARLKKNGLID